MGAVVKGLDVGLGCQSTHAILEAFVNGRMIYLKSTHPLY